MANVTITQLPQAGPIVGTEAVPIVQNGVTVQTTTGAIATGSAGTVTSVAATVPPFLSITGSPITTSGSLDITYSGVALPVASGGTGTTSPALVAGTNVTITGTWPNQTINASVTGGTGTVTSVAATVPAFLSVSGSPITTSGTLAITYSGTALPVANGGTNATATPTAGAVAIGTGSAYSFTAAGTTGQVLTSQGSATPIWTTLSTGGTVTSVAATVPAFLSISGSPITSSGTLAISYSGTALPVANGGTGVTTSTGSGSVVLSTSPTLVTPLLGTPTSGVLTNATGLPLTTGVTGTLPVANGGTGVTTSTGSGSVVLSTSPTLVTPLLGTPTSGVLTNATGLPLTTGVTGTLPVANGGTGVTTSTGSGAVVLGTSPTLNNPTVTNYVESVVTIGTVTTTNTIALTNGTVQTATLTASTACTFTMPTATAGKSFVLLLKQAASTGNGTATFTGVKWGTAGAPTITATAGKMDILSFVADGTNWYGSITQGYTP